MGKPVENEVVLRNRSKEVKALIIEKHDIERAIAIIKENEAILTFDFGRNKYLSLIPTIRLEKGLKNKYYFLERITQTAVEIYARKEHYEELVFFAAASCDVENLHRSMAAISEENRNKTREGDTVLLFFVKFTNMENSRYTETLKILVNQYKLSVNQADYKDHTPIIILLSKYDSLQEKGITRYNEVILNAVSVILTRSNVDLEKHKINGKCAEDIIALYKLKNCLEKLTIKNKNTFRSKSVKENDENILFGLLAQKNQDQFLETIEDIIKEKEDIVDIEDGNNTLLQLSCEKNLKRIVTYLIQNGVDLSKTTKRNHKTPLEISARRNFYTIFKELLSTNKIIVDLNLFTIFLLNRGRQIKTKYFDEILCCDGLQVDIVYKNGNTPLHYALIFDNTEAALRLLKRGAPLLLKNEMGKTPLDFISKEDMELYLDQCLVLDNYNRPHSKKYEMRLNFNGLLQRNVSSKEQTSSEVEVVSKICSSEKLKCLAAHPLILAFMEVKWNVSAPLYNDILTTYGFLFLYYCILAICVGHITFLFLLTMSILIFFTLQPFITLKGKELCYTMLFNVISSCIVYYFVENVHIFVCILTATLLYQFLQQHLYFSKYQALVVNGIRKVTPHALALFGLYCLSNIENTLKNYKIIFPVMVYLLIVTYSFNALVDSVGNIEHSFKILYNKNTLSFIRFAEYMYCKFNTLLSSPFIQHNFEIFTPTNKDTKKRKCYLNFYLNKNKFVDDKFHFLKLDVVTVKSLQDFVNRVSRKINQN